MYVCICARVRECELRTAIQYGARSEETVGDACGAGTGCGSCLDRIQRPDRRRVRNRHLGSCGRVGTQNGIG